MNQTVTKEDKLQEQVDLLKKLMGSDEQDILRGNQNIDDLLEEAEYGKNNLNRVLNDNGYSKSSLEPQGAGLFKDGDSDTSDSLDTDDYVDKMLSQQLSESDYIPELFPLEQQSSSEKNGLLNTLLSHKSEMYKPSQHKPIQHYYQSAGSKSSQPKDVNMNYDEQLEGIYDQLRNSYDQSSQKLGNENILDQAIGVKGEKYFVPKSAYYGSKYRKNSSNRRSNYDWYDLEEYNGAL